MKSPKPPNPYDTATAQFRGENSAAMSSSIMNNPNIFTPYGSQTYSIAGWEQVVGPDGKMMSVPRYNQTQTLSPDQQILMGYETATQGNLGQTAVQQSAKLKDYLNQSIDPSKWQAWNAGPNAANLATGFGDAGNIQKSFAGGGPIQMGVASGGPIQMGVAGGGPIQKQIAGGGDIQRSVGSQNFRQDQGPTDRAGVESAMMQLYNRQAGQQNAAENAQLAARGGGAGTPIGNQAAQRQGDAFSDAVLKSYLSSGAEARAGQESYNQASQARLNQDLARGEFANKGTAQQFAQNASQGEFANRAVGQQFAQNVGQGEFANRAQGQKFAENVGMGEFANNAQGQLFGQNQAQATFGNQAQEQLYRQLFQRAGFSNEALNTMFNQGGAAADRQNALRGTQAQQDFALRNQPINEIMALLGGSGVTMPSFAGYQGQGVNAPNIAGLIGQNYTQQSANANNFNAGIFGTAANLLGGWAGGGFSNPMNMFK